MVLFLVALLLTVVILPRRLSLYMGEMLGLWGCHLAPRYRRAAQKNIEKAFTGITMGRARQIRDRSYKNMGANIVDAALMNFRSKKFWLKRITISGNNYLKQNLGQGRGVVYLTAHIGNWELMGAFLSMIGHPINVVARRMTDSVLDRLLVGVRGRRGYNTIYRSGTGNMRKMLKVLKAGQVLGILIDQDTKVGGVFVDFFGHSAYTPTAVAQFGKMDNTVIIPGFIYRNKDYSYRVEVLRPLDKKGDMREQTQEQTRIIEEFIKKHPAQWVWMHPRWKTKKS
ncbi:MAG: lysophospholipid acyltransferase family protein [Elusimicrobiota bacterium]|nr:lysophospholipid acyltransferase family protein [Elusimicrobiota bacterium]